MNNQADFSTGSRERVLLFIVFAINYNSKNQSNDPQNPPKSIDITEEIMQQIKDIGAKNPIKGIDPDTIKKAKIVEEQQPGI